MKPSFPSTPAVKPPTDSSRELEPRNPTISQRQNPRTVQRTRIQAPRPFPQSDRPKRSWSR